MKYLWFFLIFLMLAGVFKINNKWVEEGSKQNHFDFLEL